MSFETEYTDAIKLAHQNIKEEANKNKPLIPHLMRVGKYLYDHGYSQVVVNAGILHDLIEWTDNPEESIKENFGQEVYDIVVANTKDRNIKDKAERRKEYVQRCADVGKNALIVKAADVIDSYNHYLKTNNEKELERSKKIAQLILEHVDVGADPIFQELKGLLD